jgi:dihydroorotate dehydrogenase electron transfer subunit
MKTTPFSPTSSHRCLRIVSTHPENERSRLIVLDQALPAAPGQFAMLWLPGVGEKPFSIASADPLTLLVVDVGPFSHALHTLQPGDRLWLRGPLGRGYSLLGSHSLLVAGGYGAAPLLFLARHAIQNGQSLDVCLGARQASDILLKEEFEKLGARVWISTDDGSLGTPGLVTQLAAARLQANRPDGIYACGPVKMLEAIESLAHTEHIPAQLSWEAHMRCGMGLCGHCELLRSGLAPDPAHPDPHHRPGWLVCLDGPVSYSQG